MNDGVLSQEEINALLKEASRDQTNDSIVESDVKLTDMEIDALGEIGNIGMGTAATTLSTLLGKKVRITTPKVKLTQSRQLQTEYPLPYVVIQVDYREGIKGSNILVIKKEDASIIADLMMGGQGINPPDLNEMALSAVGEAMNQMMGSATTSLSSMFEKKIDIMPPKIMVVDFAKEELGARFGSEYTDVVQIKFRMEIEGLLDSEIMQVIPLAAAKQMVAILLGGITDVVDVEKLIAKEPQPEPEPAQAPSFDYSAAVPPSIIQEQLAQEKMRASSPSMPNFNMDGAVKKGPVTVQPVQFASLTSSSTYQQPRNIDLILDVPLDITVELGKTKKNIKEILDLGPGSIIQLDKLAGEPVDLLVNGKLIAKGEVVVIDESYGIRITAIVSPMDRMAKLQ